MFNGRLYLSFCRNDIEIEILEGGNFSALIEDGTISEMTLGYKVVDRCVTYNPPMKSRPGFDGRVRIRIVNKVTILMGVFFCLLRLKLY